MSVEVGYGEVTVSGPRGTLTQAYHPDVTVRVEEGEILVERLSERKFHHSLHGLTRSLIANAVVGVTDGYTRTLELMGVGYRVQTSGDGVVLNVGYSHPVEIHPPEGVTMEVEATTGSTCAASTNRKWVSWRRGCGESGHPTPTRKRGYATRGSCCGSNRASPPPARRSNGSSNQQFESARPTGGVPGNFGAGMPKDRNARHLRKVRQMRVRKKVSGTPERPRLSVFRSLKHIYAQVIDDSSGRTIVSASSQESSLAGVDGSLGPKTAVSGLVGKALAERALAAGVTQVVFDRGGCKYHGRVKALAEGSREAGLRF